MPSLASAALAVGIATAAYFTARARQQRLLWWRTKLWHIALTTAVIVGAGAATADGYLRHDLPPAGWQYWTVYGLLAAPAVTLCVFASAAIMDDLARRARGDSYPENIQAELIDDLLRVLHQMRTSGKRGPSSSLDIAARLDTAAVRLKYGLLPAERIEYLASGDWLQQRIDGWAFALEYLQRDIVASVPDSWPKVERVLRHEIRCLTTGDLGALAWRQPPPPPPLRERRRTAALATLRALLVAALPLATVLATQPFLHTSTGAFHSAQVATGAWALIYVLVSLDPAIPDKAEATRRAISALKDTRSSWPT